MTRKWLVILILVFVCGLCGLLDGCIHLFGTYGDPTHEDGEGVLHTVYHLKHLIGAGGATLATVVLMTLGWKFGGRRILRRLKGLLK